MAYFYMSLNRRSSVLGAVVSALFIGLTQALFLILVVTNDDALGAAIAPFYTAIGGWIAVFAIWTVCNAIDAWQEYRL
jgi:hypothetical protein